MTFDYRETFLIIVVLAICFAGGYAVAWCSRGAYMQTTDSKGVDITLNENISEDNSGKYAGSTGNPSAVPVDMSSEIAPWRAENEEPRLRQIPGSQEVSPKNTVSHGAVFAAIVTAYCPCELCCDNYADGVTASGHIIQPGDKFVAADPSIPFGTLLNIPGYGIVPVLDRGGSIKGNRLDVYFDTHTAALEWGRKKLQVQKENDNDRCNRKTM